VNIVLFFGVMAGGIITGWLIGRTDRVWQDPRVERFRR